MNRSESAPDGDIGHPGEDGAISNAAPNPLPDLIEFSLERSRGRPAVVPKENRQRRLALLEKGHTKGRPYLFLLATLQEFVWASTVSG